MDLNDFLEIFSKHSKENDKDNPIKVCAPSREKSVKENFEN